MELSWWGGRDVWDGSAGPRTLVLAVLRAAAIVAGSAERLLGGGVVGRLCQPVAGMSVLSLLKAASSSAAHGQVCWRWSLARRPENASRPATCSSR
jgi:hypothetical protein